MQVNFRSWKKWIVFLCVVLILSYVSVLFFSHSMECFDTDCAICTMIEASRRMLLALVLFAVTGLTLTVKHSVFAVHFSSVSYRERTPVGLKVKLSN